MISWLARILWYEPLHCLTILVFAFAASLRVRGAYHVPRTGGLLVIANHESYMDPPMIGLAIGRRLHYLARHELFRHGLFGAFIRSLGAVPIRRELGTEGIKTTLALLKEGKAVLAFPEGTRTRDGELQQLKPGIVLLIRRAGVPILPVGIAGPYKAWPPHRKLPRPTPIWQPCKTRGLAVAVGKPIMPNEFAGKSPEEVLALCRERIISQRASAERLR